MELILLGGNSVSNKEWIEKVEKALSPLFSKTIIQYYKHWSNEGEPFDFNEESLSLKKITEGLDKYVIFAKSIGSVLTMKCMGDNSINPQKCIFVGVPINIAKDINVDIGGLIEGHSVPTLFIQKTLDPLGFFADIAHALENSSVSGDLIKEIPGDDHKYDDLDLLKLEVDRFVSNR